MPFYQYQVSNSQGQVLEGTLQAADSNAAHLALTSAGYAVREVRERTAGSTNPVVKAPVQGPMSRPVAPIPQISPRPAPPTPNLRSTPAEAQSNPQLNSLNSATRNTEPVKTKTGKDKDLFFLFTQLGSYLRSGYNPAQALHDLTSRTPVRYHDSMLYAANIVAEGGRMSDAFERYPYLYPPDVVGTIRAGEVAGFLPEAMDEVANKMQMSSFLKRRLSYFWWLFFIVVAGTPVILGIIQGSLSSIKDQDVAGGSLPVGSTIGKAVGSSFIHDLPVSLLIFGAIWGFLAWFNSMKMRDFRHRLVMKTPVIGGRARAEAMARFTWALTMISKGGLSPQNTFLLALESVPNLAVRKQLEVQGLEMRESDKLSTALRKTNLVPFEYGSIVETGEVTGDVPRALEAVHRASDADFQAQNATAVTRSSLWLYIVFGVLILIVSAWLLTKYYGGLITTILGE